MLPPFDSRGEGPAVLFAHGSEMDRTMFAPQLEHLGAAGFRAVAFDHRARGEAGHVEYSLYDLAEDARELLDQLEIERCILVGMSMGGFVALRAAIRFPERLAGVVLLGGAMHRAFEAGERERWLSDYEQLRDHEEIPAEFPEHAHLRHDLDIDSLDLLEFVSTLEAEFRIPVPDDVWTRMTSLGAIADFLHAESNRR